MIMNIIMIMVTPVASRRRPTKSDASGHARWVESGGTTRLTLLTCLTHVIFRSGEQCSEL